MTIFLENLPFYTIPAFLVGGYYTLWALARLGVTSPRLVNHLRAHATALFGVHS
jgi:hypothetical protein